MTYCRSGSRYGVNVPTDRLLIMVIAATGFAVLIGGWATALVRTEATGIEALAIRGGIGVLFVLVLVGFWYLYSGIDRESA